MAKVYDTATDLITFARLQSQNTTSGSSYLGSDGLLKFAAEDEPRIEYGSDGSLKGLLIEELRTNLLTHSEDFTDASWSEAFTGAPTPTTTVLDPSGGFTAVTLTATSANGQVLRSIGGSAGTGTSYTGSIYIRRRTGSGTVSLINPNGGGITAVTVTSQWARYSVTGNGSASTNFFGVRLATSGDEVDIAYAQLEAGSFPTSYIPTSGSQQTRSADIASIPVSAFGYNQDAGTVVVEAQVADTSVSNAGDLRIKTTTGFIFTDAGSRVGGFPAGSYTVYSPTTSILMRVDTVLSDGQPYKAAYSIAESNSALSVNGSSVVIDQTTTIAGKTASLFELGKGSSFLNGHIKSLKYYPRRLTDAQLQELTA